MVMMMEMMMLLLSPLLSRTRSAIDSVGRSTPVYAKQSLVARFLARFASEGIAYLVHGFTCLV